MLQMVEEKIINLDENATMFDWAVKKHLKRGKINANSLSIRLRLVSSTVDVESITGHELYELLHTGDLCNGSLLNWYLDNTDRISEEWLGKRIIFLGTTSITETDLGDEVAGCLLWRGSSWTRGIFWLDDTFCDQDYLAVHA